MKTKTSPKQSTVQTYSINKGITKGENMKTINMNVAVFGSPRYEDINLEQYTKRWTDHTNQICWLANDQESLDKVKHIQALVKELAEANFNKLWEAENS